jgi:hypothetical protein
VSLKSETVIDRWLQAGRWGLSWLVIAKEVVMDETLRAFLYGILILAAALIPPVISLIELIAKVGSS